jgi:hypothetical protein
MDIKKEKRRLQHLARVKKYYLVHPEIRKVGMTWPVALLERIDKAALTAGMSRQAWLNATCEAALASTKKKK